MLPVLKSPFLARKEVLLRRRSCWGPLLFLRETTVLLPEALGCNTADNLGAPEVEEDGGFGVFPNWIEDR